MISRILLLFLFSIVFQQASAQPAVLWGQRYNGPPDNADEAVSIAVDAQGNSYVTGSGFNNAGNLDIVTIKYSPSGQQLWLQSFDGTGADNDEGRQIVVDAAGNAYVVGYSRGTSSGTDITTIKYNTNGVQQWAMLYNGSFNNYDQGNSITLDASGNVYVCGYETASNYAYDFVTIKYNSAGAQQWAQVYDGPGNFNDEARDLALDASGNVYVTGPSDTFYNAQPNADMVLLKYNNSGALQWRRVYDSPGHGYEYSKLVDVDGNNDIVMIGYGFITGNGNDYYIMKYDAAGNFQWFENYNYGANTFEEPHGMVIDSLDNIIVTGQGITASSSATNDYCTVKYNSAGTFLWAARYNNVTNGEDRAYGIALDDSLCIYVTGFSKGTSTNFDIATVKYDAAGNQVYALRFDNVDANLDDAGNAVATHNGDIWVTGRSANLTNNDYLTLCYSYSAVGIEELQAGLPRLDVFPNPSGSGEIRVVIEENTLAGNKYSAEVMNALGQQVKWVNAPVSESTGNRSVLVVDTEGLEPGTYFVKIYSSHHVAGVAKFIVR